MKITELIRPGKRKPLPASADIDDIWERILTKRCTNIIDIYHDAEGDFLYRGMKTNVPWFRAASHQDRRPKDSNAQIAEVFDQLLAANGMRALRKNSIFATSNRDAASEFGLIYIIFPVDGFEYTYTNQEDIVLETWNQIIDRNMMHDLNKAYVEAMKAKRGEDWKLSYLYNWITDSTASDQTPEQGLARLKEISDDPWVQALEIGDLFNADSFRRRYNPSKHLLEHAIDHKLEVMIRGQYYAFRLDLYGQRLRQLMMGGS
jgi:hypothetical protein